MSFPYDDHDQWDDSEFPTTYYLTRRGLGVATTSNTVKLHAAPTQPTPAIIALDPDDPFEATLISVVATNRAKRADYATDGDIFSNFREVAAQMGFASPVTAVDALIATKQARLKALTANGREPGNESVADTYLDRAVYSVIALALIREGEAA